MSYHWENVTWESKDGSWNRGYYKRISSDTFSSDYDSEWDDDFDFSDFDYVKVGLSSENEALDYQPYGNPGGNHIIPYRGNSKECKELDQLAFFSLHPEEKAKFLRKEMLRKNREHFKALEAEWTAEDFEEAKRNRSSLTVQIKKDEAVHQIYGMTQSFSGCLIQDGDWLKVEGAQVYNTKTRKFKKNVHSVEKVSFRRYY